MVSYITNRGVATVLSYLLPHVEALSMLLLLNRRSAFATDSPPSTQEVTAVAVDFPSSHAMNQAARSRGGSFAGEARPGTSRGGSEVGEMPMSPRKQQHEEDMLETPIPSGMGIFISKPDGERLVVGGKGMAMESPDSLTSTDLDRGASLVESCSSLKWVMLLTRGKVVELIFLASQDRCKPSFVSVPAAVAPSGR